MGLVNYTNIENNTPADANGINQRFGDVLEQLNGNLDASNIRSGSLTRELMSQDALSAAWPIGSVYTTVESTNPSSFFGGTWVRFAQGRALMGVDDSQTEFSDVEKEGGTKSETLTTNQIPSHNHSVNPPSTNTSSTGAHTHRMGVDVFATSPSGNRRTYPFGDGQQMRFGNYTTTSAGNHRHTVNIPAFNSGNRGGGQAHNNLSPYITVYFWKRIS